MGTESNNPFAIPGFGQAGDAAHNPLMASMDMMRRAWQGMAGTGGMEAAAMATPMSVEDLDRRINELRAVENWLRLNLSMLSSTIQGLEVQRATISTLMSFAANASGTFSAPASASTENEQAPQEAPAAASVEGLSQAAVAAQEGAEQAAQAASAYAVSAETAVKGWWDMLQKQFDTLAAATASSVQKTDDASDAVPASADTTLGKKSARSTSKTAAKSSSKPAAKSAKATKPVAKSATKPPRAASAKKVVGAKTAAKRAPVGKA